MKCCITCVNSALFSLSIILRYDPKDHPSTVYEKFSEEKLTEFQIHHLVVLERIFLSAKEMEKKNEESEKNEETMGEEESKRESKDEEKEKEENSEVTKQKLLVTYLKVSFLLGHMYLFWVSICRLEVPIPNPAS